MKKLMQLFDSIIRPGTVYAHCDVPCGLYETDSMVHAADTVKIMVDKLLALQLPAAGDKQKTLEFQNTATRMVETKEKHAQLCKEQILILWTDYFKEEHLSKFPDLHTHIWKAAKLCSQAKRSIDAGITTQLKAAVETLAQIYADTKK